MMIEFVFPTAEEIPSDIEPRKGRERKGLSRTTRRRIIFCLLILSISGLLHSLGVFSSFRDTPPPAGLIGPVYSSECGQVYYPGEVTGQTMGGPTGLVVLGKVGQHQKECFEN